jgi:hypothetical protein
MGRIKNKASYPLKTSPTVDDYLIGTDYESGETITFALSSIAGDVSTLSDNNKFIEINYGNVVGDGITSPDIASAINNIPLSIEAVFDEIPFFSGVVYDGTRSYYNTYIIAGKGKGTYGVGGNITVTNAELRIIASTLINNEDYITPDPNAVLTDLGDITGNTLLATLNAATPFVIAAGENRYWKYLDTGQEYIYGFSGAAGTYGAAQTAILIAELFLVRDSALGLNTEYVQIDTAATPIADVAGLLQWNASEDTLDLSANGVTYQLGQEISPLVRNATGVTITNGTPVMFSGTLGASGRVLITPAIADGSIPSSYILGTATQDIVNGADGHVTWFGKVRHIDTTGTPYGEVWADQDILYVSPVTAGYLTNVKPSAPDAQIFIGVVINAHATTGTYFVRPSWRGKITDLDDVNGTPLTTNGQILVWNQTSGYFDPTENINDYQTKYVGYTVAGLAGLSPVTGDREYVTDGSVVATGNFGTTVVGGGANIVPVFFNGTNWIIA